MDPRNIEALHRTIEAGVHRPGQRLEHVLERSHAGLPDADGMKLSLDVIRASTSHQQSSNSDSSSLCSHDATASNQCPESASEGQSWPCPGLRSALAERRKPFEGHSSDLQL